MMRPDFSPLMLKVFLRARAGLDVIEAVAGQKRATLAAFKDRTRREAGISTDDFDRAWRGQLRQPKPRTRLWGALGHVPADSGVLLTIAGQERP